MYKRNIALIAIFLAAVSIFGPMLAPFDPDYLVTVMDYHGERLISPFGPNEVHLAGTDRWGHDMLTRILYGFRYSVIAVVALAGARVLIGGSIGIRRGLRREARRRPRLPFAVPAFIIVYFTVFRISIGSSLSIGAVLTLQGTLIVAVGVPGLISSFASDVRELMDREFVLAARSLGAGDRRIVITHLLPHLWGNILSRFVGEAVAVLALLGQLAMFNVFLGGTEVSYDPILYYTRTFELAGMVGQYRGYLTNHRWLLIAPLIAYLVVLLSFFAISRMLDRLLRNRRGTYV